jgi:hypothetical protein
MFEYRVAFTGRTIIMRGVYGWCLSGAATVTNARCRILILLKLCRYELGLRQPQLMNIHAIQKHL